MKNHSIIYVFILLSITSLSVCSSSKMREDPLIAPLVVNAPEATPIVLPMPGCQVSGCYNEICSMAAPSNSTLCEWKDEFMCLMFADCALVNGQCKWTQPDDYHTCLKSLVPNDDCQIFGCLGQYCEEKYDPSKDTDCKWKEEYDCLFFTTCGKTNGKCMWNNDIPDSKYSKCMKDAMMTNTTMPMDNSANNMNMAMLAPEI
jgi:eight-cysteine-cluster-containing protein